MQSLALQAGTAGGGWGWMGFDLGQMQGLSLDQMGTAGLNYRQFMENMALQRGQSGAMRGIQAEDAWAQYNRGMTQLDWQQQDLTTSFGRQMTQFTQQLQDLTTNFGRSQTQSQWATQDLSFQANQQALGFGWNMEDIQENMRYATGRQRRQLARQAERQTIQFGMNESRIDTEEERLKEREQWATDDFNKDKERLDQRRQWSTDDFNKEKERIDVRRGWLDDDLQRSLARIGLQAALEEEQWKLKEKQYKEDLEMQKKSWEQNKKYATDSAGLQAASLEDEKKRFEFNHKQQVEATADALAHYNAVNALETVVRANVLAAELQVNQFFQSLSNPDGVVGKAIATMADNMVAKFAIYGDYDSSGHKLLYKAFTEMIDAAVLHLQAQISSLAPPAGGSGF